ncbi:tyrosine-type recombinase/integrase [Azohydromonas lata]|uniref:tyrosine-type recombinase/integrase n=1 Tax=Azohydromonas lata TaxID=45677 RepID=UPI00082D962D|nr:tyrosine-type recombinase/integrase [Azohydromonas lata]
MAYIRKATRGYRAEVERAGQRRSRTFRTKREAQEWAAREESLLLDAKCGKYPAHTVRDALERYAREISPKKGGGDVELYRLRAIPEQLGATADKVLSEVTTADIAAWRDARLRQVTPGSVQRDINLIRNVWAVAAAEWGWCGESPFKALGKPGQNPARERRITPAEVRVICRTLNYITGDVRTQLQQAALAFLIGLRTAMRAGEILSLVPGVNVDLQRRVARVAHKTQHVTGRPREVPLSRAALRLMRQIPADGFTLTGKALSSSFRTACKKQLIDDLHFHDSRAEALTRLSRKVDVMTLAKISGHKDLRILQNVYYRETAEDIARRL